MEHAWKLTCHQTHLRSARLQRHPAIIQRPHAVAYSERIGIGRRQCDVWCSEIMRALQAQRKSALRRLPYSGFDQKFRLRRNVTTASAESAVWPAMRAATAHANAWKELAQRIAPSEAETTGFVGRLASRSDRVVPARADRAGDFVRGIATPRFTGP